MKAALIAVVLSLGVLIGCTDAPNATRVLEQNGYKDVQMTGYRWFICGDDYTYQTGFAATNIASGQHVTGAVCSGIFKGNSIKLD